jgi:hypothetical protein
MQQKAGQATLPAKSTSSPVPIPGTNTVMMFGRVQKPNIGPVVIRFGHEFAAPPVVTISPAWLGSDRPVGTIDTVTDIQPDEFTVISPNAAANFYIDWIAIGKA